jgi:Uma2 family endonuclease
MTITTTRMGLEDFFAYTSDRDTLYELEDGELIEMPPESDLNQRIASFLFAYFLRQGVASDQLRTKTEIASWGYAPPCGCPICWCCQRNWQRPWRARPAPR